MKKYISLLLVVILAGSAVAEAQYGTRIIVRGGRHRGYQRERPRRELPPFTPSVNISLGYGFPNLAKDQLYDFYNTYRGSASQHGPFIGAIDYQFSRFMSIGVITTYGKVTAPYYNYNSNTQAFTGSLENWGIMLNMVRYMPVSAGVSTYVRTAIGVNTWQQQYSDATGNKIGNYDNPSALAYQLAFGAKFKLSKQSGLFIEAGYGKYILGAGLSFKL